MANPSTNYGFVMPTPTDLVTDLPADFEVFGQAVDTQMKTNADAATQKATLTTKGDIYAATGTSTPARLAVGSNDQVLTADSSTATGLKWAAASAGGLTLISTTTLSGTTVSLTSIPQTYRYLYLIIDRPTSASGGNIDLRWGSTAVNTNTRYIWNGTKQTGGANSSDFSDYGQTSTDLMGGENQSTSQQRMSLQVTIPEYTKTDTGKTINWTGYWQSGAGEPYIIRGQGGYDGAFYVGCIDILSSTTLTGGTAYLYGGK